jgi:hypothetical protein
MSKLPNEEKNEQKGGKALPSMSSRQQILFLMNKTQSSSNWENADEKEDETLDYSMAFMKRKEKIVSIIFNF